MKKSPKSAGGSHRAGAPAPAEWLRASRPKHGGVSCYICDRPELVKIVAEFVSLGAQLEQVTAYLREYHAFPHRSGVVGNHLRRHVK
jgi:hypothetical protein